MGKNRLTIITLCFSLLLIGCNSLSTAPEDSGDRIIEGVNITKLFSEPSPSEINAILKEWEGRDVSVEGVEEVASSTLFIGSTQAKVRIVSHNVDGMRHFGAIVVPLGAKPVSLPLLIISHGGEDGVDIDVFSLLIPTSLVDIQDDFIYVIPSFRSEPLVFAGTTYLSEGEPSPWDRDVDDALALLNIALETTTEADPTRIGILGFSRGACVGMLMAVRDPRIDLVVEFFGPTDFFGPFVQEIVEEALRGDPRDLPGVNFLNRTLIQPLKNGEVSIEDFRPEIIRRSPVYFAERLPGLQVHHGTADTIVPVSQAKRLIEVMGELGRSEPEFEYYLYEDGGHNPLTFPKSIDRTVDFLTRLIDPTSASLEVVDDNNL